MEWTGLAAASAGRDEAEFARIAEETRDYLIGFSSGGEAERERRHETLNRAVLGYAEDRKRVLAWIQDFCLRQRWPLAGGPHGKYGSLAEAVFAEIVGFNVLELLMNERDGLEEIQVVGTRIFEVRGGMARPSIHRFKSVGEVERLQQNLVLFNQDKLTVRKRWAEVRLSDGSRVTMTGFGYTAEPTVTIRFHPDGVLTLDALCGEPYETLDRRGAQLLRAAVKAAVNLVIAGSTNSGKTQLLKALVAEMPEDERLVTIEPRFELMLDRAFPSRNIVQYEIDEDDPLHDGRQAFKLALRQSPNRILLAEIRDADANLYVRACTRGHAGSMTTVHAGRLEDVPDAIAEMCMQDGRAVDHARLVRRIAAYVTEIGIEMANVGGQRKVVRIGEYVREGGDVRVRTLYARDGMSGGWTCPEPPSPFMANRLRRALPDWEPAS
jgi:pilus assembly protein CpaF